MAAGQALRILVTGAAGAGTSTLAAALAQRLAGTAVEADDLFWLPTDPPYRDKRPAEARHALAREALARAGTLVVAGSVMGWGREVEDAFDLIVFLHVPTPVRLERLRARETARFGRVDEAFLKWAGDYDIGPPEGRSLARHIAWMDERGADKVTLAGRQTVDQGVARAIQALGSRPPNPTAPTSATRRG